MTLLRLHGGDPDWVVVQRDQIFSLLDANNVMAGELELHDVAAELPILFCNGSVLVTQHNAEATTVTALTIPNLTLSAQLQLPGRWMPRCVTGQRIALLAESGLKIAIVRVAARALAVIEFDIGAPAEFVLGLDKHQVVVGAGKKLETFDALTGRPMMRVNVTLPPAPRHVGAAQGHLWITRPGSDSLTVVRLSDGRVFPHVVGAEPLAVYSDLHSPYIVIATDRGLVRLQCFSHSLVALGTPPAQAWALQPHGNDTMLLGMSAQDHTPWRAGLGSNNAISPSQAHDVLPVPLATPKVVPQAALVPSMQPLTRTMQPLAHPATTSWRSQLAAVDVEVGNLAAQRAAVPAERTLMQWCSLVGCSDIATAAIIILYARHLRGAAPVAISHAARYLGDQDTAWHEVLGHGQLAAHGLLNVGHLGLSLSLVGCRFFDDSQPSLLLRQGTGTRQLGPGIYWSPVRTDLAGALAQITQQLSGGLAVLPKATVSTITEAYLHGLTIVLVDSEAETQTAVAQAPSGAALVITTPAQPWFVTTILPQP